MTTGPHRYMEAGAVQRAPTRPRGTLLGVSAPPRGAFDSISLSSIPAGAVTEYNVDVVFWYADGDWPTTEAAVRAQFPNAIPVSITVTADPAMEMYDCETGNGEPADAVTFIQGRIANGSGSGIVYCGENTWWGEIQSLISAAGLTPNAVYFVANYDGDPAIPDGALLKQYADSTMLGFNADLSSVASYVPGIDAGPDPARGASSLMVL